MWSKKIQSNSRQVYNDMLTNYVNSEEKYFYTLHLEY